MTEAGKKTIGAVSLRQRGRRSFTTLTAIFVATALVGACEQEAFEDKVDPLKKNVIDDANLTDLLLTAGAPNEAIVYFERALQEEPDRADYRRGLAISLARAKRYPESVRVYQELIALGQAEPADELEYAVVSARMQKWDEVRTVMARIPSGLNTERKYLVTAMLADHEKDWAGADAAYARAEELANNPANILNNWGVSKMSRGELDEAEVLFERALSFDSRLFNAKNNLVISRGLRGIYQLPIVPMTETEKAIMLNNLGVIAQRKGETKIAKGLYVAAVETHPQHYAEAAGRLSSLEANVEN